MSQIQWKGERCILCMRRAILSLEHVIPESIGGILTCRFLCSDCNSRFGAGFEAKARLAPELRQAALQAGADLSQLSEKLERGAAYRITVDGVTGESRLSKDGALAAANLRDGSIIVPEKVASIHIISILKKRDMTAEDIARALRDWQNAQEQTSVDLGHGVMVRKWQEHPATPTYGEPVLSRLVPLKIAFEFAALIVGTAIEQKNKNLDRIRQALVEQDENFAKELVVARIANRPQPLHGIIFQGNLPEAQIQIRLFGLLAYVVNLRGISISHQAFVYTHNLSTGEDWASIIDKAET